MSEAESGAVVAVTLQLASDRAHGRLQGDVSPSYLQDLLAQAAVDGREAFQAALQRGIDHLAAGGPVKHVDTRA